jgi:hypothetical protein
VPPTSCRPPIDRSPVIPTILLEADATDRATEGQGKSGGSRDLDLLSRRLGFAENERRQRCLRPKGPGNGETVVAVIHRTADEWPPAGETRIVVGLYLVIDEAGLTGMNTDGEGPCRVA